MATPRRGPEPPHEGARRDHGEGGQRQLPHDGEAGGRPHAAEPRHPLAQQAVRQRHVVTGDRDLVAQRHHQQHDAGHGHHDELHRRGPSRRRAISTIPAAARTAVTAPGYSARSPLAPKRDPRTGTSSRAPGADRDVAQVRQRGRVGGIGAAAEVRVVLQAHVLVGDRGDQRGGQGGPGEQAHHVRALGTGPAGHEGADEHHGHRHDHRQAVVRRRQRRDRERSAQRQPAAGRRRVEEPQRAQDHERDEATGDELEVVELRQADGRERPGDGAEPRPPRSTSSSAGRAARPSTGMRSRRGAT